MKIGYLDCFAGVAGDMFLGALIEAGVPLAVLQEATASLGLGASLRVETVDRSGISCTKVHVMEGDRLAEETEHSHTHEHPATHLSGDDAAAKMGHPELKVGHPEFQFQPKTQHLHKVGHGHSHDHEPSSSHLSADEAGAKMGHPELPTHTHVHGRSLTEIRALIGATALAEPVKALALEAFELLGQSEAKIHNVPVEAIHFHEVGAVDAIVDIVAASAGVHHLKIGAWHCSPLNVGGGMVVCAHGTFPVPAPATADLLRGVPTYSAHVQKELVTPTGAALVRALKPVFGPQPAMRVEAIGYGAGTRNPKDFPNVLRLSVGESDDAATDTVTVMETALDDLSPQVIAHVTEQALAKGALDVMLTPVVMKKGRPGTLLTLLCNPSDATMFEGLLLSETSTLGVRVREERRVVLERRVVNVKTEYGDVRVKVGTRAGEELNVAPEFEDCRAAALKCDVPVKRVQQAALAAYLQLGERA
ncbi:nickel pincer cofactor biosynthesis protein LarC [Granulicella sp. 5B5]|uniref:nickel pincer cofactor biosynthesis protein LarC n=1 Tax=Granulicella sp. 5B5 TaxID=1617967 RepID=UPI0015F4FB3B|nr:nickel pincer cofactor biosynthesis protein LarC [Granulicella sp. 5B5]QMV19269.1 nickel pincer cofactor biosynthesis protein LarC [Granulicella sp. 5B5]